MGKILEFLLVIFIIGILFGYITISDCSECSEDYPLKDFKTIQFYYKLNDFPVATFDFRWQTKENQDEKTR